MQINKSEEKNFKNELEIAVNAIKEDLPEIDIADEIEIEDLRATNNNEEEINISLTQDEEDHDINSPSTELVVKKSSITKSIDNELAIYLQEVRKYPSLSAEEEYDLAVDWANNQNVKAAHKLVTSHLKLVAKIAMGFRGYGLPMMDVISEGNVGLMQAVKKFDPKKGFRLSTYAMWWIKASIQEYILKSWSLVKIGTTAAQKKLFFNLRRIKNNIGAFSNRSLSNEELQKIASDLGVSEKEVEDMNSRLTNGDSSLNELIDAEDSSNSNEAIDFIISSDQNCDESMIESQDLGIKQELLQKSLQILNDREKVIILARRLNENPKTLQELSVEYNISAERIRQIEEAAMKKIRKYITDHYQDS